MSTTFYMDKARAIKYSIESSCIDRFRMTVIADYLSPIFNHVRKSNFGNFLRNEILKILLSVYFSVLKLQPKLYGS